MSSSRKADMYKHEILISRYNASPGAGQPSMKVTADPNDRIALAQPANFTHAGSWARRARFTIAVYGVLGAPTAWSLGVKFQGVMLHTGNTYRYQQRLWYDLATPAPEVIATEATSLTTPLVKTYDIATLGADIRAVFSPSFTGGTAPGLDIVVERELWS
jgi:hypothetical protein